ncbi:GNAT family N-acetyltransferase [Streptomyces tateyamensis]|uniref:GNAT family N-acetyltransferase n=1 Tax=Streptomyces tateyamensis TaxID=565073 RepID=A0A2V4NNL4_9ACTN|nr:GNAT family N-acetyltransferase [Streptomyces tateyamensis]PYC88288.1 GNAT family N-acetyltransferase [Streptomyces tateyamensis]
MTERAIIRPYRPTDRAAVADICVRTGLAGGDSREVYPDLALLPSIFAEPYTVLEPELAFVVDDGERAVGYVLGTADTAEFVRRFRAEWLPRVAERLPRPAGVPVTPGEQMAELLHTPERMLVPELADYPAHLHIDLLPSHQRAGYGRELIAALLGALNARGVGAVHLGMLAANAPAGAFYRRLGFRELAVPAAPELIYFGRSTSQELAESF